MKPGSLLFLSRSDLLSLGAGDMATVIPPVKRALAALRDGQGLQPAKTTLRFAGADEQQAGLVNVLPAAISDSKGQVFGLKALGAMPSNVKQHLPRATGLVVLFDGHTKTPLAVMDAQVISAMRTGAVSALAAEKLCRHDATTLGLIGAGVNMRTQLLGLLAALPLVHRVSVYSRGDSKDDFVAAMSQRYPSVNFRAVQTANEAVADADVVVTCVANTSTPVVAAAAVNRPGITIFNIGCLENEPILMKDMDLIVSDNWEQSKHRGVQTHAVAYSHGIITDDDVSDLGAILAGTTSGRTSDMQKIFFCPTGLGIEDVAVAYDLYGRARHKGVGAIVELWEDEKWI